MRFLPFLIVAIAVWLLIATPAAERIFGLDHGSFSRVAIGGAVLLWMLLGATRRLGGARASAVVGGALTWMALLIGLVGVYAYRNEFADFAERVMAELAPGEPQVGAGGEVIVNRRLGGEFVVVAYVNGARVPLLFDTGASSVVLTAEDARRAGINPVGLEYDVSVTTANGVTAAAAVRLRSIAVGPIAVAGVRALVAQPGAMSESLLGMTFLEKLKSYAVERGRLVLKGG